MLGLDVSRLAVPDYEVVTRLERLIQNHHATNAGLHPGFFSFLPTQILISSYFDFWGFLTYPSIFLDRDRKSRNFLS